MTQPIADAKNFIENGTHIVHVRNTQLAACLVAVGIHLRKDPPYTIREEPSGEQITTWNFEPESPDGIFKTRELVRAWTLEPKWSEENPTHPFTFAMHAIKNYKQMVDHIITQRPRVAYASDTGKHNIWCMKGSKREQACIDMGLRRISP